MERDGRLSSDGKKREVLESNIEQKVRENNHVPSWEMLESVVLPLAQVKNKSYK